MSSIIARRVAAALLTMAVTASSYGCAGTPMRRGGAPGTRAPGTTGVTGGPGAGTANRGVGTTGGGAGTTGGTTGAPAGGTTGAGVTGAGIGGTLAGLTGAGAAGARTTDHSDLGQRISSHISSALGGGGAGAGGAAATPGTTGTTGTAGTTGRMGATGTPGAGAGPTGAGVGVSTLVIGNTAYVGIDSSTLHGTMGTLGARGGTTGGTAGARGAAGTTGTPMGAGMTGAAAPATPDLTETVRSQVRSSFPQIAAVHVTTDRGMVSRIARLSGQAISGVPVDRHLNEMFDIARTMTPGTTTTGTTGAGGTR